ncbi:MAG TPA: metal-dependent transcriptional regulator [Puia sp.]|nr:metal-dependent transcriptional regulator [Puia sp.]
MKNSASKENYLKAIYHLQHESGTVSTNEVAALLQTSAASVTDMLKKLKKQKLLLYERYRGVRLTPEGKKMALQVIRKHRLWEYFLVEKLKFGWDEVHDVAEELEHVSSKKLIDHLDKFLNFPQTDPHGDPIPDEQGRINQLPSQSLLDIPLHKPARVSGIASQNSGILELLQNKNIGIGTRVEIRKKYPFDNSIELKVKNQAVITLSEQVAKNILVQDEQ